MNIITIVKDDPEGLLLTFKSVLDAHRNGLNIERWIIKLSSSVDKSLTNIQELPDYAIVCCERDFNLYDGMNIAVRTLSKIDKIAPYTMLLNAGDSILPTSASLINSITKSLEHKLLIFSATTKSGRSISPIPNIIGVGGLNFCHQAILFDTKLLIDTPFPTGFKIAGDYSHFIRLCSNSTLIVDYPIVEYSLDGISERCILQTRIDNFRAGYEVYGLYEVIRVFKMYAIRLIFKVFK